MFGKPQWFRKKTVGWGLRPVSWKGWGYALSWAAVICVPFIALLVHHKLFESLVWVVAMMFALLWDVQQVMRELGRPTRHDADLLIDSDILIIDEDTQPDPTHHATRSYDLHVGR